MQASTTHLIINHKTDGMPTKVKMLILDFSRWRSGLDSRNKTGRGNTHLRNKNGFECCLGQFSKQLNKELSNKDISELSCPMDLCTYIPLLTTKKQHEDTELSNKAIDINDDTNTTPDQKISLLRQLFGKRGLKIKVINRRKK